MTPEAIGLILLGAFLSFATAVFFLRQADKKAAAKDLYDEKKESDGRIADLEKELSLVRQAVVPLNAAYQAMLIKELTHYHTPEMDGLMKKLDPFTLTDKEFKRLRVLLRERTRDLNSRITQKERKAAAMLPTVIERAKEELGLEPEKQVLQVVAVPQVKAK